MPKIEPISTPDAPSPGGHYSQATRVGDFVFVSGILGIRPDDAAPVVRSFDEQARVCLANLAAILAAAGSSMDRVAKATVYIDEVGNWPRANAVFAEAFGSHRPARAIVPTGPLHHGFSIEIEAVAVAA